MSETSPDQQATPQLIVTSWWSVRSDKVPANDREKIEKAITELREAIKGDDIEKIKRLTEEVQQTSYALSQQLYAQQAEPQTEGGSDSDGGEEEGDVVEGEFREA